MALVLKYFDIIRPCNFNVMNKIKFVYTVLYSCSILELYHGFTFKKNLNVLKMLNQQRYIVTILDYLPFTNSLTIDLIKVAI